MNTKHQLRPTPKQRAFLAAFGECGNLSYAAKAAQCCRSSHYTWLREPEYSAVFAEVREVASDALEQEARRRAVQGTEEPVFYKGEVCGAIRRYSDNLLMFLLEAARPEVYARRSKVEVSKESIISDAELERIALGGCDDRGITNP